MTKNILIQMAFNYLDENILLVLYYYLFFYHLFQYFFVTHGVIDFDRWASFTHNIVYIPYFLHCILI